MQIKVINLMYKYACNVDRCSFYCKEEKNLSMKCFIPERIFDRLVIEDLIVWSSWCWKDSGRVDAVLLLFTKNNFKENKNLIIEKILTLKPTNSRNTLVIYNTVVS